MSYSGSQAQTASYIWTCHSGADAMSHRLKRSVIQGRWSVPLEAGSSHGKALISVKARNWMKADNGVRSIFYTERCTRRDVYLTYFVSGLSGGQDKEFKVVAESVGSCREGTGTKPRAQTWLPTLRSDHWSDHLLSSSILACEQRTKQKGADSLTSDLSPCGLWTQLCVNEHYSVMELSNFITIVVVAAAVVDS